VVYSWEDATRLAWLLDCVSSLLLRGFFSELERFGQIGMRTLRRLWHTVSGTRLVLSLSGVACEDVWSGGRVLGCPKFVRLCESIKSRVGRTSSTICGGSTGI
jgi:hypothetical protein